MYRSSLLLWFWAGIAASGCGMSRSLTTQGMQVCDVDSSTKTITVNRGMEAGLTVGMILILSRNQQDIGAAQVIEVYRRNAIAQYTEGSRTPAIGDEVRVASPTKKILVQVEPIRGTILEAEEGGYRLRIDRGTDHGVFAGMLFDVFRGEEKIGRIRVTRAYAIRSEARAVDRDEALLGGDQVVEAIPPGMKVSE